MPVAAVWTGIIHKPIRIAYPTLRQVGRVAGDPRQDGYPMAMSGEEPRTVISRLSSLHRRAAALRQEALPYMVVGLMAIILTSITGAYWAYLGRVDQVAGERRACQYDVKDRRSDILVLATQAWAAQQIADDPKQPARTRRARSIEAAQDRDAARDRLTRVDDKAIAAIVVDAKEAQIWRLIQKLDADRRLDCATLHPAAKLLPGLL